MKDDGDRNTDQCADCKHARGHHWEGGSTACAMSCRCMQFEEEGDFVECDHGCDLPLSADGKCVNEATSYCSGCECWRCDAHGCACDEGRRM